MRFFSVAAVFLAAVSSVFADDLEERDNTIVNTVHVTNIVTVSGASVHHETKQYTVTSYQTVHEKGYKSYAVSMPPLRPFTKKPKVHTHSDKTHRDHTTKVHEHSVKSKHARDVTEYVHATVKTVETVKPHETKVHTESLKSTVRVKHTKTAKDHHRPHVTGLRELEHKKPGGGKPTASPVTQKEKRAFGAGWWA